MKDTGISRRIDDLGRIVIPKEVRNTLHIRDGDALEMYIDDGKLVLRPLDLPTPAHLLLDAADALDRASQYTYANKVRKLVREIETEEE